jgi:iron-sulfur cluster repair protein YtfE (RIC family)
MRPPGVLRASSDPVRQFEHAHASLTRLALEVREIVHAEPGERGASTRARRTRRARLEALRDALLEHFANEEEGLFPFVRQHVPALSAGVDALQRSHDVICGALVRLTHLLDQDGRGDEAQRRAIHALYERFEQAYTAHSHDEARLFEELGRTLGDAHRRELAAILRGL